VLDTVASAGSVENFNNRPNGPYVRVAMRAVSYLFWALRKLVNITWTMCSSHTHTQKLYLFSLKTGAILNFSSALCDIESNVLDTGDCLLLEMVANKKK
jgi:hypothetical protein